MTLQRSCWKIPKAAMTVVNADGNTVPAFGPGSLVICVRWLPPGCITKTSGLSSWFAPVRLLFEMNESHWWSSLTQMCPAAASDQLLSWMTTNRSSFRFLVLWVHDAECLR